MRYTAVVLLSGAMEVLLFVQYQQLYILFLSFRSESVKKKLLFEQSLVFHKTSHKQSVRLKLE